MKRDMDDVNYGQYLAALLAGDHQGCSKIVRSIGSDRDIQDLYLNLFQRSLYEIGDLWDQHRVSVAVGQLATAITERLMAIVQPQVFGGGERNRSILVACVPNEYHQIGARMVADLAEVQGWRGYFLGANTAVDGLLDTIDRIKPDLLGLSLSVAGNFHNLSWVLEMVRWSFPDLPVLAGGQAFHPRWGNWPELRVYPNVRPVLTMDELEKELSGMGQG